MLYCECVRYGSCFLCCLFVFQISFFFFLPHFHKSSKSVYLSSLLHQPILLSVKVQTLCTSTYNQEWMWNILFDIQGITPRKTSNCYFVIFVLYVLNKLDIMFTKRCWKVIMVFFSTSGQIQARARTVTALSVFIWYLYIWNQMWIARRQMKSSDGFGQKLEKMTGLGFSQDSSRSVWACR